MKKYLILGGIILVLALYVVGKYNSFVMLKNETNVAWAQVENQYQRRFDLVPQLVNSVKGVFKQEGEKDVYLQLAETREAYAGAKNLDEKVAAAQRLDSSLSRLLAITENYPQLKANENVLKLQDQLEGGENRLSVERGRYNETVGKYNGAIVVFPSNMLAKLFGFTSMSPFAAKDGSSVAPVISF